MSAMWQLKRLVPLGIGGVAVASFVAGISPNTADAPTLDSIERVVQGAPAQAICDVDGVDVSYHTAYRSAPDHGYDVVDVVIEDVNWPSCSPARLRVALDLDGANASGDIAKLSDASSSYVLNGTATEATVTLPVRIPPADDLADAADAMSVAVELEGGTTPIPTACAGMKFNRIQVGTLGNDSLTGTNPSGDLIYGLEGADTITSLQGDDCVDTDADDTAGDTVTLGNGANVVSTGAGADTIKVGNGSKNKISAGAGNDSITVGNGKGNVIDGGLGINKCYVPKSVKPAWIELILCEREDT
jgi:hypothetical protein